MDFEDISEAEAVDEYLQVYQFLRQDQGSPLQEDFEQFKRNVYECILLESMRTLYYKPDNQKVVDHLVKVVDTYKRILAE